MPQGVAMERRNEMESRSRPKWRSHFGMPPRGCRLRRLGVYFVSRYAITMSGIVIA